MPAHGDLNILMNWWVSRYSDCSALRRIVGIQKEPFIGPPGQRVAWGPLALFPMELPVVDSEFANGGEAEQVAVDFDAVLVPIRKRVAFAAGDSGPSREGRRVPGLHSFPLQQEALPPELPLAGSQ